MDDALRARIREGNRQGGLSRRGKGKKGDARVLARRLLVQLPRCRVAGIVARRLELSAGYARRIVREVEKEMRTFAPDGVLDGEQMSASSGLISP